MISDPTEYKDFKIFHYGDSFGKTLVFGHGEHYMLDSFIVTAKNGEAYTFMFAFNTVDAALHNFHVGMDALVDEAEKMIKARLDNSDLVDRAAYTYEYNLEGAQAAFNEVNDPVWRSKEPI